RYGDGWLRRAECYALPLEFAAHLPDPLALLRLVREVPRLPGILCQVEQLPAERLARHGVLDQLPGSAPQHPLQSLIGAEGSLVAGGPGLPGRLKRTRLNGNRNINTRQLTQGGEQGVRIDQPFRPPAR